MQTPMHAFKEILQGPACTYPRPSLPPSPAKSGLHSHTPSSELWFAVVSGNSPWRSESPCPRTVTGGGDCGGGEQVGGLGASSAEWVRKVGAKLLNCKQAPKVP